MEWTHREKDSASGAQYNFMSLSFHEVGCCETRIRIWLMNHSTNPQQLVPSWWSSKEWACPFPSPSLLEGWQGREDDPGYRRETASQSARKKIQYTSYNPEVCLLATRGWGRDVHKLVIYLYLCNREDARRLQGEAFLFPLQLATTFLAVLQLACHSGHWSTLRECSNLLLVNLQFVRHRHDTLILRLMVSITSLFLS